MLVKSLLAKRRFLLRWVALLMGILIFVNFAFDLWAEKLWFEEVAYLSVFWVRVRTQAALGLLGFTLSMALLWGNLTIADCESSSSRPVALPGRLKLRWLLPLTLIFSLLAVGLLFYYSRAASSNWQVDVNLHRVAAVPESLSWQIANLGKSGIGVGGVAVGLAIALLVYPQLGLKAIALLCSLSTALVLSEQWAHVLPYFHGTPFERTDPLFDRDLSFYLFQLPLAELLEFWLVGLLVLTFVLVLLLYLLSGNSLSQAYFPGFSLRQRQHLFGLGGGVMLAVALTHWVDRYQLLYSPTGAVYGAGYTDVAIQLPAFTLLSGLAATIAGYSFYRALADRSLAEKEQPAVSSRRSLRWNLPQNRPTSPKRTLPILLVLYLVLVGLTATLPPIVQHLAVQPNELVRELPFIERSIAATRNGFGLDAIEVKSFELKGSLTAADLRRNNLTIDNIRLWDTRPLLQTNRQLQRFRPYYEFPGADIDRYILTNEAGQAVQQQVLISARELDYSAVPADAKTWVNEHLTYTHGYGFTLSPVNVAGEGGLPDYLIQGIDHRASTDRIRNSIPIGSPRIYYGELTHPYVMTATQAKELDYPSGSDNVYNTYDGRGGISIGNNWRRLLFAKHLYDWRMLLTQDFTPQTRLLFRRNVVERVKTIAPFLRYDSDPYLVVADAGGSDPSSNYLYWMIDAYTTSDRYPYSAPGNNDFNYIRNSVKVVVDAYHGTTRFYVADGQDPVIQTWSQIFPDLFQPLSAMPLPLQTHLRYPQDLYRIQSDQLLVYHMTDPQVFYNREDQWRAPNEIYGGEQRTVEPYYLIMKLPGETSEEFLLFRPFTPDQRTNLTAWLAARSPRAVAGSPEANGAADPTANAMNRSGRMLLYRFTKQDLVYGLEQLEARINQDPIISQQITLWNRQGSRAIQGNLLVIPIENSLLYVEPLYLEAEQNQIPTLVRVIVAYGNRIAMAETLQQALSAVFQAETAAPAIVRPVESSPQ